MFKLFTMLIFLFLIPSVLFAESPDDIYKFAKESYDNGHYNRAKRQFKRIWKDIDNASYLLGSMYEKGLGGEKSKSKSIKYYEFSARNGNKKAINVLAGFGIEKWRRKLAKNGDAKIQFEFAMKSNSSEKKFDWLSRSANGGYLLAKKELAKMYLEGKEVYVNNLLSFKWYKESANDGDIESQLLVGNAYFQGFPIEKNLKKALYWYTRSACSDNLESIYNVAFIYYKKGISRDFVKSYAWSLRGLKVLNNNPHKYKKENLKFGKLEGVIFKTFSKKDRLMSEKLAPRLCNEYLTNDELSLSFISEYLKTH